MVLNGLNRLDLLFNGYEQVILKSYETHSELRSIAGLAGTCAFLNRCIEQLNT